MMANRPGQVSPVQRVWRAHRLQPHRVRKFKLMPSSSRFCAMWSALCRSARPCYRALGRPPPPFEQPGRMTYPAFFKNVKAVADYRDNRYRSADWDFAPGATGNWESQHPPLYYVLMAPIMKATEGLSLVTQVFTLRAVSYLLAFLEFMIGWRATSEIFPDGIGDGYLFIP